MLDVIASSFTQGLLWAVMAVGVYITFRLLDIADLSAEGVFPLGAAVSASIISMEYSQELAPYIPFLATLAAFFAGSIAGFAAGLIHTKLNIPPLLTGILVLTGLYSINLNIMDGRPNIALLGKTTIFTGLQAATGLDKNTVVAIVTLLILLLIIGLLVLFLHTEIGLALRATGDNDKMSEANGINTNRMKIVGYMIGNGLIGLSGAMLAQNNGFADIGMGTGTIVIGLASVIIAEVVVPNLSLGKRLTTVILGSFVYRLIIDTILNQPFISVKATDLRLFQALLLMLVLYLPEFKKQQAGSKRRRELARGRR
ncbi:ABC transporter permease [Fundicoccus sp. Sow4_D5]|uniref:ABC transporter permease n=1 Tax=unclassified Fundicoccus TaxID=2761543 RepID=UPI003F8F4A98